jgi:uncharacterized membrane protein YfcA
METYELFLFVFLALIAEIIGTISGFGSSVFFVPVAAYFFDFHSVLGITAVFHIFSNISKIVFFRKGVKWKIVLKMGVPAILFVSLGALLSKYLNNQALEIGLAVFLIFFSLIFLLFQKIAIRPTTLNSLVGGTISGFVAGLFGTGGAIRGMTLAAFNLQKDVFIATSAFIDVGVDLSRGLVYFSNGFIHYHDLGYVLILICVSFVGTYIGKLILQKISETLFKKIVLGLILGIGIVTLLNQFFIK